MKMADGLLQIVINGFFTGIAVTVGTYLANKALIKNLEKLVEKLNKKQNENNSVTTS